jgi:hypothetical protein
MTISGLCGPSWQPEKKVAARMKINEKKTGFSVRDKSPYLQGKSSP